MILMLVCIVSSRTVFAASEADGYDFRADEMEDAPEIEKIKELENSILQELYTISPGIEPDNTVELDYEDAVKTYNYTPETFLELAESPQFVHDVLTNANYNWKIPVDIRDDGIDYAVVYQDEEGWNYYTASADDIGRQRLEYLIYKENLDSLFPGISAAEDILVLSISDIKTDVIIVSNGETLSAVPFASSPDLLGIDNKEVYSLEEFAGKVESYLSSTQITNDYSEGGVGKASSNYIVVYFMFVLLAVSFIIIKKKGGRQ